MKPFLRIFLLIVLVAVQAGAVSAQSNPVTVRHDVIDRGGGEFTIVVDLSIRDGWHIYDMGPYTGGPIATSVVAKPSAGARLAGGPKAGNEPEFAYEEAFSMRVGSYEGRAVFHQDVVLTAPEATVTVTTEWQACNAESCLPPMEDTFTVKLTQGATDTEAVPVVEPENTDTYMAADTDTGGSLWSRIVAAFAWGLAALFTPCVFPMVPVTVSYFMGGTRNRLMAAAYGAFIVLIYTLPVAAVILATRLVGGDAVTAGIFNWVATHWLPNVVFFVVFMVFAASLFGAFDIRLPGRLVNRSDRGSDRGGLAGVFFMALTLVLVSFSCTAPVVSNAVIKSTYGELWEPVALIMAFAVAFALPFVLLAFFPALLKKLPRSGSWLNTVKVLLGFAEVALALKFLSVADQTHHWGILDREVYLAIWITVSILAGAYLLGWMRFRHDTAAEYTGVGRLALVMTAFSFAVYLVPGMFGAPLKALSGYLPPMHTQDFFMGSGNSGDKESAFINPLTGRAPLYSDFLHMAPGFTGFFDLAEAEEYARAVDKPLFIDLTGQSCVNCREMEARVWTDPGVGRLLRDEFVMVALFLDDRATLAPDRWVTNDKGQTLKTLGKVNAQWAQRAYGTVAMPYYVIRGRTPRPLVPGRGYDLNVEGFREFLLAGIEAYKKES